VRRIITAHPSISSFSIQESTSCTTVLLRSPSAKLMPKSSGDYASVSSVTSYTHSVVSSNFTLSSATTDGSSAPSLIFDRNKPRDESKMNAFLNQLKKLYRDVSHLETKLLTDSSEPQDENRIVIKGGPSTGANEAEKARSKNLIEDHKRYVPLVFLSDLCHLNSFLSEMMLCLPVVSLASGVPASLRNTRQVQHNHLPLGRLFLSPPREFASPFPHFQDCV
jgi:hypothetical protein